MDAYVSLDNTILLEILHTTKGGRVLDLNLAYWWKSVVDKTKEDSGNNSGKRTMT